MSILSGFKKVKRHIKTGSGYQLLSQWTSSQTVEMDDGTTVQSAVKTLQDNDVYLTKAEYDALPNTKLTDGKQYHLTDVDSAPRYASDVVYNNTNVADALTTLNSNSMLHKKFTKSVSVPANTNVEVDITSELTSRGISLSRVIGYDVYINYSTRYWELNVFNKVLTEAKALFRVSNSNDYGATLDNDLNIVVYYK